MKIYAAAREIVSTCCECEGDDDAGNTSDDAGASGDDDAANGDAEVLVALLMQVMLAGVGDADRGVLVMLSLGAGDAGGVGKAGGAGDADGADSAGDAAGAGVARGFDFAGDAEVSMVLVVLVMLMLSCHVLCSNRQ